MKAVIYYFTGTGNTLMVCRQYQRSFAERGVDCDLFSVCEKNALPDADCYDFVGFAYPIHGFNAPYVMYKFVRRMPIAVNKKYFVVKTSGEPVAMNNASSIHFSEKLKKRGYTQLTNEYHYVMPYNMIFRHTDSQAKRMWDTAMKLIPLDVDEILGGVTHKLKKPPFARMVAWVLRIEHSAMKVNGKMFKVHKDCVHCMKCVKNCPVGNITYDQKKGKFRFGGNCVMCARCSFNCPKDAISIGMLNGWRVNGAYNFENPDLTQKCKKPNYCKKSYQRYFERADERIKNSSDEYDSLALEDMAAVTLAQESED